MASLLLVSPTGTGKSYIQGAIHRTIREQKKLHIYSTFPSVDIARPVFLKTYGDAADPVRLRDMTEAKQQAWLESHGFWTIKRLHNELVLGRVALPDFLQHDEAHHSTDDTHELVHGICGLCPRIGATATDYRGTPAETTKLRERWPRFHRVLTLKDAVQKGRLSMPSWGVWPLLNDETIDVVGGEFKVSVVESHISDVLDDLVDRVGTFYKTELIANEEIKENSMVFASQVYAEPRWDRPTMIAVPGVGAVKAVVEAMERAGLPAVGVTGETKDVDRQKAFDLCVKRRAVLVQIRVVGEGVDLPIRRLIDLAPTMSPVLWMQRVGRITRPVGVDESAPEYIACCHNLARHAYLWHGVMPVSAVREAQAAWGKDFKPSRRFLARAIDVEGLGRFEPAGVSLLDGTVSTLYAMQTKDGLNQYAVVLHPLRPEPWFFSRSIPLTGEMAKRVVQTKDGPMEIEYREKDYDAPEAKWKQIEKLPELKGMISVKPGRLTPGQVNYWKAAYGASRFGLDPNVEVTNREFQLLPILSNSKVRLEA